MVNEKRNSKDSTTKLLHLQDLTYIECKNPDGTTYLQMLDSDGEVTNEDSCEEFGATEYNQDISY